MDLDYDDVGQMKCLSEQSRTVSLNGFNKMLKSQEICGCYSLWKVEEKKQSTKMELWAMTCPS